MLAVVESMKCTPKMILFSKMKTIEIVHRETATYICYSHRIKRLTLKSIRVTLRVTVRTIRTVPAQQRVFTFILNPLPLDWVKRDFNQLLLYFH